MKKISRKNFLKNSIAASSGLLVLSELTVENKEIKFSDLSSLIIMAPYWGFNGTVTEFCKKAKEYAYDGIEILFPNDPKVQNELAAALNANNLKVGFLCRGDEKDVALHLATYKKVLQNAMINFNVKPIYINSHTGKDFFSDADNQKFIDVANEMEYKTGVPLYHETHRSRMLYSAPAAVSVLEKNPNLKLTLDISHWCNVSESYLEDQPAIIEKALQNTFHVHSRIGHPESPQISDPRAPEWKDAVAKHFTWWDKIVAAKKAKGDGLTMLTEFGPPSYMPTIPYTNMPVADQWDINVFMMQTWRKRYL